MLGIRFGFLTKMSVDLNHMKAITTTWQSVRVPILGIIRLWKVSEKYTDVTDLPGVGFVAGPQALKDLLNVPRGRN